MDFLGVIVIAKKVLIIKNDGSIAFEGYCDSIPIPNNYVIEKSIEIFNDDDPCIINSGHIILKLKLELLELLDSGDDKKIPINNISKNIKRWFELNNWQVKEITAI